MIVSNSTVLIFLSKIGKLHLLKDLFKTVIIPPEVKREVVDEGKKGNHVDAVDVENGIRDGWIKVENVQVAQMLNNVGIDRGEAEAISLAHKKKAAILIDQTHARDAARLFFLKPRGTIYVLLTALKRGKIDYDGFERCLLDLIGCGFRMSEEVYIEALRLARDAEKR